MTRLRAEDYEILADLRYLGRKFLRFSKDLLRAEAGLNPEQYEALLAIKADEIEKAVASYTEGFSSEQPDEAEGDAVFKLAEHQFRAIFEVEKVQPTNVRHCGIMVRDEKQLEKVREKLTNKYKLKLEP